MYVCACLLFVCVCNTHPHRIQSHPGRYAVLKGGGGSNCVWVLKSRTIAQIVIFRVRAVVTVLFFFFNMYSYSCTYSESVLCGLATISRLLKMIGLFCKRGL